MIPRDDFARQCQLRGHVPSPQPPILTPHASGPYNASMMDLIYLDHNSTTPMLPEVADAVREASLRYGANPASQHEPGRQARRVLEEARERVGELLGARVGGRNADRLIFTSGGTEANNLAIFGLLNAWANASNPGHLVISVIEHPSVAEAAQVLEQSGWHVDRLGVDARGVLCVDQLGPLLRPETRLVSLMLGNNETGVMQPVARAAEICATQGVPMHCDAVQVVGKLPVHFGGLNLALMSSAAHKFHGPTGVGVLVVRHGVALHPTMFGGHQQAGLRPGTEMVALVVGMQTALECWHRESDARRQRLTSLRDRLEQTILDNFSTARVIGREAPRLPNTANVSFVGLDRQALVMALDLAGVACSTGSACASGSSEPSPSLAAMRLPKDVLEGSIRFSLGATTTAAEIDEAACRILRICQQLRHDVNR